MVFSIQDRFDYHRLDELPSPSPQWSWCRKIGEFSRSVFQTCTNICTIDRSLSWKERVVSWLGTLRSATRMGSYAATAGTAFCTGAYGVVGIIAGKVLGHPVVIVEGSIVILVSLAAFYKSFRKMFEEREDFEFLDIPGSLMGFTVGTCSGVYCAILLGTKASDKTNGVLDFILTALAAGTGGLISFPVGAFVSFAGTAVSKPICKALFQGVAALKDGICLYRTRRDSFELEQIVIAEMEI